jgi:cbb3-type cytochrome oxidase maturation protein
MNIIFVSIPLGLILIAVAIAAFFWAIRSGQYDDLDSPAWSILMDEDREERQRKRAAERRQQETDEPADQRDAQDDESDHGR